MREGRKMTGRSQIRKATIVADRALALVLEKRGV